MREEREVREKEVERGSKIPGSFFYSHHTHTNTHTHTHTHTHTLWAAARWAAVKCPEWQRNQLEKAKTPLFVCICSLW